MAFRASLYSFHLENGRVDKMSLAEYLSYVLFFPIMQVGPITRPDVFQKSFRTKDFNNFPLLFCIERIVFGLVKYQFVASVFEQTSFNGLFHSGFQNHWIDILYAGASYYLYIYFNFSGFCDIAIGLCGLVGIAADENFNRPFLARNIQDFWTRWHITLSGYMREVMFTPLNLVLVRTLGLKFVDVAMVITILISFTLIGVWHGKEEQFLIFGLIQSAGVTINYFYGKMLKKTLGSKGYKAYMKNRLIRAIAIVITFLFLSLSFFYFATSETQRTSILNENIVKPK
ncbi:MAG: MBOAT family O-acyltransferase [Pseudobdellovibrionaceae bacterium]